MPKTTHELFLWNALLLVGYIAVAGLLDFVYRRIPKVRHGSGLKPADYLFNGATFSASVILGFGLYDENVLKLIGDTTGYLILAGVAGLGYSLLALKPKP